VRMMVESDLEQMQARRGETTGPGIPGR
jgi:hypothetical protein